MTALFPVSSIADVRDIFSGKDVMWQFPRIKRGPSSGKSRSSGNGEEEWQGAAATLPLAESQESSVSLHLNASFLMRSARLVS